MASGTTQLKLLASYGKCYKSDVLDYEGIIGLGKAFSVPIDSMDLIRSHFLGISKAATEKNS